MSYSETGFRPCQLCGAEVLHDPVAKNYSHPFSDRCPLDSLTMYSWHRDGWNRMDRKKERDLITRMALLLDGLQEALERAALVEKTSEAGKPLRQITLQQRAKASAQLIKEAVEYLEAGRTG